MIVCALIVCGLLFFGSVGCGPSKPKAVDVPAYDSAAIAAKAMELYDTSKDGKLDAKELEASPALLFSLKCGKTIDTDSDGSVSTDEIKARVDAWIEQKVGLSCPILKFVDKKGNPPKDAIGKKVTLTPDPIQGDLLKTTTPIGIDENGQCSPSTPGNLDNLSGMSFGFYTITIEGTSYKNLGVEIFDGAKEQDVDSFTIELKKAK